MYHHNGSNWHRMTPYGPNGPKTLPMGILHDIVSCWTTLGPFQRPTGAIWASERPQGGPIWHIIMYYTHENCFRATWTIWGHAEPSSGPRGPSEDLWDPLEEHLGPKRALLGIPWGPEEARYQAKVCDNHNSNPVRPIGSSWDQIWPLWCVQKLFSQLGSV